MAHLNALRPQLSAPGFKDKGSSSRNNASLDQNLKHKPDIVLTI